MYPTRFMSPEFSRQIFEQLYTEFLPIYGENEAKSLTFLLLEHFSGLSKTDIVFNKKIEQVFDYQDVIERIKNQEPVQYVIGETEFYGRKFKVTPDTLIPRPETEELVHSVVSRIKNEGKKSERLRILDIGTGSGCIAISLACELPQAEVYAYDISENALKIAQENANKNQVNVRFEQRDILQFSAINPAEKFDIIVSNPPYVMDSEAKEMHKNVLDFEPHLALFVPDDNALIFYEAIVNFAVNNLIVNGLCMVEINQQLGLETAELFWNKGFSYIEVIKDLSGKDRFVRGVM
jgi:release factor glutamine methyltransferase